MCFRIFFGDAEVKGIRVEDKPLFRYFDVLDLIVASRVEDMVFIDGQPFTQMHIIRIGAQAFRPERINYNFSELDAFPDFLVLSANFTQSRSLSRCCRLHSWAGPAQSAGRFSAAIHAAGCFGHLF